MHSRVGGILRHPAFGVVGWMCAVMAGIAAIQLYREADSGPELAYALRPLRTSVVHEGRPSAVRIFQAGSEIRTPVTVAEVVVWNKGNRALRPEHLVESVRMRTSDGSPILDLQVKPSRGTTAFRASADSFARGSAGLAWRVLAPGDGASLRVTYAGGPSTDIRLEGAVDGQRRLRRVNPPEGIIYPRTFNPVARRGAEWYAIFVFAACLPVFWGFVSNRDGSPWIRWGGAVVFGAIAVFVAREIWWTYREPPFGF